MKSSRSATTPDRRLIVFVPELEALLGEAEQIPRLIAALTRPGRARSLDAACPAAMLATGLDLPAAALSRLHDFPDDAAGSWIRADPIGLTPDLAAVWLQPDRRFADGRWMEDLQALLCEEGFELSFHDSGRGYLRLAQTPICRFFPPSALAGSSLEHCLPEGLDAGIWRRLLNETQVQLHQHVDRHSPESVPGTLWFWGAGRLPRKGEVGLRIERLVASDPVIAGLGDWLGLGRREADARPDFHAGELVEWPAAFELSAEDNLRRLDRRLRRAWRQLRLGRLRGLELGSRQRAWSATPADAWRIWR